VDAEPTDDVDKLTLKPEGEDNIEYVFEQQLCEAIRAPSRLNETFICPTVAVVFGSLILYSYIL